jgi:hypothetical protein
MMNGFDEPAGSDPRFFKSGFPCATSNTMSVATSLILQSKNRGKNGKRKAYEIVEIVDPFMYGGHVRCGRALRRAVGRIEGCISLNEGSLTYEQNVGFNVMINRILQAALFPAGERKTKVVEGWWGVLAPVSPNLHAPLS